MEGRRLTHQKILVGLVLGDLLGAALAYGGSFWLRVHLPVPFTGDFLPSTRIAEVTDPPHLSAQEHLSSADAKNRHNLLSFVAITAEIYLDGLVLYLRTSEEIRESLQCQRYLPVHWNLREPTQ